MKNKLLLSLLLSASLAQGVDIPIIIDPSSHSYIFTDGTYTASFTQVIDWSEIHGCLKADNVEKFKKIEKAFQTLNYNIFNLRYKGFSLLQHAIFSCKEDGQLFDYILSQISAHQLNEYVTTSIEGDVEGQGQFAGQKNWPNGPHTISRTFMADIDSCWYYGTAAAVAALTSPVFLKKIIHHPLFDKQNFIDPAIGNHLVWLKFSPTHNWTMYPLRAGNCMNVLRKNLHKKDVHRQAALLMQVLSELYL